MGISVKKKLTPKDFNPKQILGQSQETRKMVLGTLFGIANDITERTSDQGELMRGLVGKFRFNPADGSTPLASYVLWLPSGMGNDLFDLPAEKHEVEFAFRVAVMRAENPAGYEWALESLIEAGAADPLAALMQKAGVAPDAQLTAPEAQAQLAAPEVAETTSEPISVGASVSELRKPAHKAK